MQHYKPIEIADSLSPASQSDHTIEPDCRDVSLI
jgi:hypothetical protein